MIKYLGSKRVLIPRILEEVGRLEGVRTVLDLFSGTSRVAHALKARGLRVHANDHNAYAAALATAYVQADRRRWLGPARRLVAELDAIPGVPGVGEKTAAKLIQQYGSLDGVLEHAEEVAGKVGESLRANAEEARASRTVATIRRDARGRILPIISPPAPATGRSRE